MTNSTVRHHDKRVMTASIGFYLAQSSSSTMLVFRQYVARANHNSWLTSCPAVQDTKILSVGAAPPHRGHKRSTRFSGTGSEMTHIVNILGQAESRLWIQHQSQIRGQRHASDMVLSSAYLMDRNKSKPLIFVDMTETWRDGSPFGS